MNQKTKGHGFFRQSKAYGLVCGIALAGAFFFGTASASADEVVQTAPAPADTTVAETPTVSEVVQPNQALTDAISNAEAVTGQPVTQDPTQEVATETVANDNYDAQAQTINQQVSDYQAEQEAVKEAVKAGETNPETPTYGQGSNGNYTASDSWTNLKSATIDNDIHVVAEGTVSTVADLTNGNYTIKVYSDTAGKLTDSHIISKISWGDAAVSGGEATTVDQMQLQNEALGGSGSIYDFTTGGTTRLYSVKQGEWVTIPGAVVLADGSVKDLLARFTKTDEALAVGGDWVNIWNANGLVNYINGGSLIGQRPGDGITVEYQVSDDTNGSTKYIWVTSNFDIDGGQILTLENGDTALVSIGGGMRINGQAANGLELSSDEALGYNYGKAMTGNALDGGNSIPDGTVVYVAYTGTLKHNLKNTPGGNSNGVANGDFGLALNVHIPVAPQLSYHLNAVPKELSVIKDVLNQSGVSINNGTLKLGETGTYSLTGAFLSKDRLEKAITQYDFEDLLDTEHDKYTGYKVYAFIPIKLKDGTVLETKADLAAYAKQTYDESNGRFYVSLNSDFLASVADDSDFQVAVDIQFERIKTGTVENTFTNIVNGQRVVSNTVVTHTPSEPDPETPAPEQPKPETPVAQQAVVSLPQTGESVSVFSILSGICLVILGFLGVRKKQS